MTALEFEAAVAQKVEPGSDVEALTLDPFLHFLVRGTKQCL